MDEDLTASHWDDLASSSQVNQGTSKLGSMFDTLNLEDPHRDPTEISYGINRDKDMENTDESDDEDGELYQSKRDNFRAAYKTVGSPFQSSNAYTQSEIDELNAIEKQKRETHKSSLMMELTSGVEEKPQMIHSEMSSVKLNASESLFDERGSPLKLDPLSNPPSKPMTISDSEGFILSPKASQLKTGRFTLPRTRRMLPKTVIKHLGHNDNQHADPLSSSVEKLSSASEQVSVSVEPPTKNLFQAANLPLYDLPKPGNFDQNGDSDFAPTSNKSLEKDEPSRRNSNDLEISLGDPLKVGDITNAHIVYTITTQNNNPDSPFYPKTSVPFTVSRRYKDFRWIYHQLQNNHPGRIIPPPPSKQTYIGRFNENFVENRRQALEKMLQKISRSHYLADDSDFVLFLTSQNFAEEAKESEQVSGSGASIQASNGDDDGDKSSNSIVTGSGATGFMSSLFSITTKYPEPDEFFSLKKGYIEDIEHNLKTFYKSLELIANQRVDMSAVMSEIAMIVEELADLEITKSTTSLLSAFSEVHVKLKENLDRLNLQDQLTLGFTIEEYLRVIGSVKYTLETRTKIYQQYQSFKQELMKKEESLDRLNSRYRTSADKINQVRFEVDKLKQKVSHFEQSFTSISDTIKSELENFEIEKIHDFRNSVEIFIESSIESQKEAIELWETFYERQNLAEI